MLALLASAGNAGRSTDALIEAAWSGAPPATARKSVQKYVSRLRVDLGDALKRTETGYRLDTAAAPVDTARFESLLESARAGTHMERDQLDAALALRTGVPFEGFDDIEPLVIERNRLDELWRGALEQRLEMLLDDGRHEEVVAEAERLIAEQPFREGPWRCLMLAMHRSGRSAEALEAYGRCRLLLGEELGIEPSEELRILEQRILQQDPSLAGPSGPKGNLPQTMTSFVGRAAELDELLATIDSSRLTTLIGPGGSGKTRLAIEAARSASTVAPDGAWLVELAPVAEGSRIGATIGGVFGLLEREEPMAEVLITYLDNRRLLLVVDNCEHVIGGAAAEVSRLLRSCPELRVLATSREPLGVAGETIFEVGPLALPPEGAVADELRGYGSTQLLLDRAGTVAPGLEVAATDAGSVIGICTRLDGLPLAIELAAARLRSFSPRQLYEMLDDRFSILQSGRRDVLPRQQTLEATIDWSYRLLNEAEQTLFARLSVFSGAFDLDGAEAICGFDLTGDVMMAQLVAGLVDRSMVEVDYSGPDNRFTMLETLRAYGLAQLGDHERDIRRRHARYFATMVGEPAGVATHGGGDDTFGTLFRNYDSVRAALGFLIDEDDPLTGLRMATGLEKFWDAVGHRIEAQYWIDRAIDRSDPEHVTDRIRGLLASSYLHQSADLQRAIGTAREALQLAEQIDDKLLMAAAKRNLGWAHALRSEADLGKRLVGEALDVLRDHGDRAAIAECMFALGWVDVSPEGIGHLEAAVGIFRELGDDHNVANGLYALGANLRHLGQLAQARAVLEESLAISERSIGRHDAAHARSELGQIARLAGDFIGARTLLSEALAEMRDIGDRRCTARMVAALAWIAAREGETATSARLVEEAIDLAIPVEARRTIVGCLQTTGLIAAQLEWSDDAATLLEGAVVLQQQYNMPVISQERAAVEQALRELPTPTGPDGIDHSHDINDQRGDGADPTLDQLVARARDVLARTV